MSFAFNEKNEKKFNDLIKRYPNKSSLMLPSLWMIQYQEGWISKEAMEYLANRLDTSAMDVYSVASFYSMFHLKPIGKYTFRYVNSLL